VKVCGFLEDSGCFCHSLGGNWVTEAKLNPVLHGDSMQCSSFKFQNLLFMSEIKLSNIYILKPADMAILLI